MIRHHVLHSVLKILLLSMLVVGCGQPETVPFDWGGRPIEDDLHLIIVQVLTAKKTPIDGATVALSPDLHGFLTLTYPTNSQGLARIEAAYLPRGLGAVRVNAPGYVEKEQASKLGPFGPTFITVILERVP
jgi:hypothetical protein